MSASRTSFTTVKVSDEIMKACGATAADFHDKLTELLGAKDAEIARLNNAVTEASKPKEPAQGDINDLAARLAAVEDKVTKLPAFNLADVLAQIEAKATGAASKTAMELLAKTGGTPASLPTGEGASAASKAEPTFADKVGEKIKAGASKTDAIVACVREFPELHATFIQSGKPLTL